MESGIFAGDLFGDRRTCSTVCFFFQAEDGIRDLVRSRGLGDVYKRQGARGVVAGARLRTAVRR